MENLFNDTFTLLVRENIVLGKICESHINDLFEILSDDATTEFIIAKQHYCIDESYEYYKKILQDFNKFTSIYFGIILNTTNKLIGFITLHNFDYQNRCVKLGYVINKEYRGQGITLESLNRVIHYVFENSDLVRIQASISTKNIASIRFLEKANFIKEGLLRKVSYSPRTQCIEDRVIFSLIRDDIYK